MCTVSRENTALVKDRLVAPSDGKLMGGFPKDPSSNERSTYEVRGMKTYGTRLINWQGVCPFKSPIK